MHKGEPYATGHLAESSCEWVSGERTKNSWPEGAGFTRWSGLRGGKILPIPARIQLGRYSRPGLRSEPDPEGTPSARGCCRTSWNTRPRAPPCGSPSVHREIGRAHV